MGWDRLRGHPTVVGEYLRAGARRPWRHSPFGVGCRSKTDRRYRGGHGKHPGEPSVDVLPRTRRSALAARLPPEDFGCHVHNFRKWTWQPLIPQCQVSRLTSRAQFSERLDDSIREGTRVESDYVAATRR